jgi:hypothetical protein
MGQKSEIWSRGRCQARSGAVGNRGVGEGAWRSHLYPQNSTFGLFLCAESEQYDE